MAAIGRSSREARPASTLSGGGGAVDRVGPSAPAYRLSGA